MGYNKIYLVTRRAGYNYGSSLQAFALQTLLEERGTSSCEILNVKELRFRGKLRILFLDLLASLLNVFPFMRPIIGRNRSKQLIQLKIARNKFDYFNANSLKVSSQCFQKEEDLSAYVGSGNLVVCGSDQIWNPLGFSPIMFLSFVDPSKNTLASYAPSFGISELITHREDIKRLVTRFKYLSVREETGKQILSELTKNPVDLVLDPTLVVRRDLWNEIEQPVDLKKSYILCYFLSTNSVPIKFIQKQAKSLNLEVINVQSNYSTCVIPNAENRADFGPKEFLYLVRNATLVCTNSFHCCIFSHIYKRKFYVFNRFEKNDRLNQNSRIESLLKVLGLEDCWVDFDGNSLHTKSTYSTEESAISFSLKYMDKVLRTE